MAEKFDISEHIKVEALGVRVGYLESASELVVNGNTFDPDDFTLTPVNSFSPTNISPLDMMSSYNYVVNVGSGTMSIYWRPIPGATSYRYYLGIGETPLSYTTVTSGNTYVTLTYASSRYFKVQALVSGQWVDIVAQDNGTTYTTSGVSAGWYRPNPTLNSYTGYAAGGLLTSGASVSAIGINNTTVSFSVPTPAAAGSIYNAKSKYLIGISGAGPGFPQYEITPRSIKSNGVDLYIESPYSVEIPSTLFDPTSAKISISLLKTDNSVEPLYTLYTAPEAVNQAGDSSTLLQPSRPLTVPSGNLQFPWEYQYLNQKKNSCTWTSWPTNTEVLKNTFGSASVGYQIYHENRATNTFTEADNLQVTGQIAKTVFSQTGLDTDPLSIPSRTQTSTTVDNSYLAAGYNLFSIYPLLYSDYTIYNDNEVIDAPGSYIISDNLTVFMDIRKSDYVRVLTLTFNNFPSDWSSAQILINGSPTQLITGAIPTNGTFTYQLGVESEALTGAMNFTITAVWGVPPAQGGGRRTIATINVQPQVSYEVGTTEIGRKLVRVYDENVSYGLFDRGSGTYEYIYESLSTASDTRYIALTDDVAYPKYRFEANGLGVVRVTLNSIPSDDFVLAAIAASGSVYESVTVGDPYGFQTQGQLYASGWWPLQCSVSNVDITQGYNVERGLLKTPEPGRMSISLKGSEGDPRTNTALQLDNKIRVKLAATAAPDNAEEYLFSGFIENMATEYDTRGNITTSINAVDAMSRVLNVQIPSYVVNDPESFSDRMYRVLNTYIAPETWGVAYDDSLYALLQPYDRSVFPPEDRENVSASEIINELTEGEYAVMLQSRAGVIFWYNRSAPGIFYDEDLLNESPSYGFSTEHNATSLDHFCISDFTIENSIEDIINYVTASITYDELTKLTYSDQTSIDRYGQRSSDVQLNLYTPAENTELYLQRWVDEVPYTEDQSELRSITANVINRNGYVTRAFMHDAGLDPIRVYIQTGPVSINGVWFAKSINHNITPEGWKMTLDLTAD